MYTEKVWDLLSLVFWLLKGLHVGKHVLSLLSLQPERKRMAGVN